MAILTEKEVTINGSGASIELFAQYSDGKLTSIHALLDIDGARLSGEDHLGYEIHNGLMLTSFYTALTMMLNDELREKLYLETEKLIRS